MRRSKLPLMAGVALSVILSTQTFAQTTDDARKAEAEDNSEIVVTGTILRGIAPVGTNSVNVSAQQILASGATNTNQILARIPQVTTAFNATPTLPTGDPGTSLVRPNIRNLAVAAGGTTTLVLLDGHRMVNAGVLVSSVSPDVIAPAALERVDVIPDGGSATYGSDAVGGVINLITRRRFDGVQIDARYGIGDNYHSFDTSLLIGKDWGSGSAYLSYAYAQNDAILGRDRDYVRQISANDGRCAPGMVSITRAGVTTDYALPGRTPGTTASCDTTDGTSIWPEMNRHALFGSVYQEVSDSVTVSVRGYYTHQKTTTPLDLNGARNFGQSGTITSANPYYVPIGPNDPGTQAVKFSYASVFQGRRLHDMEVFSITPELNVDLGGGWKLDVLGNFGRSTVDYRGPNIDGNAQNAALAATTTAAALNPYNLAATNSAVLASIYRDEINIGRQTMSNARVILDGSPVSLPGGDVKLAIGAEYLREGYNPTLILTTVTGQTDVSRTIKSLFGEVAVPLVGSGNATGGVRSLVLSASGRYDHYSVIGGTFNPKFGLTYKPADWVSIRGNWGTSFNAPAQADGAGAVDTRAVLLSFAPFRAAGDNAAPLPDRPQVILAGGNPNLKPQTAHTWSIGADIEPPVLPGLKISATYYNVRLKGQIGIVPLFSPDAYLPFYSAYVIKNPTQAQLTSMIGSLRLDGNLPSVAALFTDPDGPAYSIIDARRQNLGVTKQDGIDFNVTYDREVGFGSIFGQVAGTYTLSRKFAPVAGATFSDALGSPGTSRLGVMTTLGARSGGLTGSVSWTHSAGYNLNPAIGTQTKVKGFNVFDLFLSYDVAGAGLLKDLSFTVNVNNVFDQNPPFYNVDPGFTNGSTLGRVVQFGVRKKF